SYNLTYTDSSKSSPNGHLDLFLRFLLGLSLPVNPSLLLGLVSHTGSNSQTNQGTVEYFKWRLDFEFMPGESYINLLYCLSELNDHSLLEEVQRYMREGCLSNKDMSFAEWSAVLEEFDLRKYDTSEEAFLGLLPVLRASPKVILSNCSCYGPLALVLNFSCLTHLDLSNNFLGDSEVEQLCSELKSASCRLEVLSLSCCELSARCCGALASVLSSSCLTHLDVSNNDFEDSGVEQLCSGLKNWPHVPH
uniref:NACHT LRR and PYD domain-containing protein n=1 Tax=Periophthalmus magnuspinnatus TaxID=409849 RepID=A0A3B3ZUS7_9GOBI